MTNVNRFVDIKEPSKAPKGLKWTTWQHITLEEPTEEGIIRIIRAAPYAFNPHYWAKYAAKTPNVEKEDSPFGKALKTIRVLKSKGFVKMDKKGNWVLTTSGRFHIIYKSPIFKIAMWAIPILLGFLYFILK